MTGPTAPATFTDVTVIAVHDGDTVSLQLRTDPQPVLLGFATIGQVGPPMRARLAGMAARELRDPGGPEAQANLHLMLDAYRGQLAVTVPHWDEYGARYDAVIWTPDGWIHELMVAAGYAAPWNGRGKQPRPPWPIP